mmetsp:Transcript_5143/g.9238  ORF Transcript_5143/g.9238 Transcript_5143/m.9238 type:complete len:236 (+) Transcript_5143:179-886(+)
MGGDGGTLAVKRAYIRGSDSKAATRDATEDKAEAKAEAQRLRYTTCALSGEALRDPVVCCPLGRLYNKEAVLVRLLSGDPMEEAHAHIKLKELTTCELTRVVSSAQEKAAEEKKPTSSGLAAFAETERAAFMCPITQLEMDGNYPFVILLPTGQVLSERAIRQVPEVVGECKVLPLNPSEEVTKSLRAEMLARRAEAKKEKKNKKEKKTKKGKRLAESEAVGPDAKKIAQAKGSG